MIAALAAVLLLACAPARASAPSGPTLEVEARAFHPGELILLSVAGHDAKAPPEASLNGLALEFFAGPATGTWLAFAGLDLDFSTGPATLETALRAPGGRPARASRTLHVVDAGFPVAELSVNQKFVTPDKSDAERAEAEAARLHQLFSKTEAKRLFDGTFASPIPGAPTARFGERRLFNGQPRAPHSGMDLRAKTGVPVRAPAAGKVLLADPLFYAGNTVILDHGLGLTSQYAHLSQIGVKPGDMVKKGQVIGKVGATGRVTGPHLHWALKFRKARVDPFSLVYFDLDARLKARPADPLKRSELCGLPELPPARGWSKASGGLRARARPAKTVFAPGEIVSLLVEIQNPGKKAAFVDFVRDAALRPLVLGVGESLRAYETLPSSSTASGALTEQVKIPPGRTLCFEQNRTAEGPLLALETTSYALAYGTEFLYPSTSTVRAGLWRGRLALPPVKVSVSTGPAESPSPESP
ncbi:MAG: M23 family metallopeptidase [Elusimicrobiota bacterium]|nr:M23 family metallopeptidase [Elusimicrobiota bacterium]